ncbi:LOW QUALITY PROTEIN: zinc finger protein Eos [Neosynchiropus ocellatus]
MTSGAAAALCRHLVAEQERRLTRQTGGTREDDAANIKARGEARARPGSFLPEGVTTRAEPGSRDSPQRWEAPRSGGSAQHESVPVAGVRVTWPSVRLASMSSTVLPAAVRSASQHGPGSRLGVPGRKSPGDAVVAGGSGPRAVAGAEDRGPGEARNRRVRDLLTRGAPFVLRSAAMATAGETHSGSDRNRAGSGAMTRCRETHDVTAFLLTSGSASRPGGSRVSGERMNADDHDGPSYAAGLAGNSIKVEPHGGGGERGERSRPGPSLEAATAEFSERREHGAGLAGPIRLPGGKLQCEVCGMICIGPNVLMVHKRSHTGERPFRCGQCGASFTQKGNLLRHVKLHSGEKPFKCPVCSYACRRRDALAGHLRTHAVSSPAAGQPFKCGFCSRSYKQQGALSEHQARCHSCLKSQAPPTAHGSAAPVPRLRRGVATVFVVAGEEAATRPAPPPAGFALSLTKRKRSTPQKFSGEAQTDSDLPEAPHELSSGSEKEAELVSSPPSGASGLVARGHPVLAVTPLGGSSSVPGPQGGAVPATPDRLASPDGCPTDTESTPEEPSTRAPVPTSTSNHRRALAPSRNHSTSSPILTKDLVPDWARPCPAPAAVARRTSGSPVSREAVRVLDGDGQALRCFHCRHCRILFLDHVMFTIHMGCHGYRQPLECNICGHRSQDRYEFSSHISRGEHQVG